MKKESAEGRRWSWEWLGNERNKKAGCYYPFFSSLILLFCQNWDKCWGVTEKNLQWLSSIFLPLSSASNLLPLGSSEMDRQVLKFWDGNTGFCFSLPLPWGCCSPSPSISATTGEDRLLRNGTIHVRTARWGMSDLEDILWNI